MFLFFYFSTVAQSVAVINGSPVRSERICMGISETSSGEYQANINGFNFVLNIYIDFKLKVQDALKPD
ncbi:hypothetical protein CS542_06095 [Pedobacter sp. IW39]|nr:hypothetical protein CS542_06095 [Pedobacter sp. IW39]